MFAAFKFCAIDYLYESVARQKFAVDWLLVHIPNSLHQDENYCHTGVFAEERYRRPWTRGTAVPTCSLRKEDSLDELKKCFCMNGILEKKWKPHFECRIGSTIEDVVPSSNPNSQLEMEDICLLSQDGYKEEAHQKITCLETRSATILEDESKDLVISEDIVFKDHLAEYARQVPSLLTLLSRLKPFAVRDPLLDSKGEPFTEESIFRFTIDSRACIPEEKENEPLPFQEDFCLLPLDEEESLMLPCELELCTKILPVEVEIGTKLPELKAVLHLDPEQITDEIKVEQVIKEKLVTRRSADLEISFYCPTTKIIDTNEAATSDVKESHRVSYTLCQKFEVDVPLTPPDPPLEKKELHYICSNLKKEQMSPTYNIVFITESTKGYLQDVLWQSERYQDDISTRLLKVPQIANSTFQHLLIPELKTMLHVCPEITNLVLLEEHWWREPHLNLALKEPVEKFTSDLCSTTHVQPVQLEEFNTIPVTEMEIMLDVEDYCSPQRAVPVCSELNNKQAPCCPHSPVKSDKQDDCNKQEPPAAVSVSPHNVSEFDNNEGSEWKLQNISVISASVPTQEKKASEQVAHKRATATESRDSPSSSESWKNLSCRSDRKYVDDPDPLTSFIMLRTKQKSLKAEQKVTHGNPGLEVVTSEANVFSLKEDSTVHCEDDSEETAEAQIKQDNILIEIPASDSQCQAYRLLEAAATPVMNKLLSLGISLLADWKFAHIHFDRTRFFLKQQEKAVNNSCKQGKSDEREVTIFKHAALVHLLVTVRDLLLMCNLDTALGYLLKAKDMYKSTLGTCLDEIWRRLAVLQYIEKNKQEINPKTTALQDQLLNWLQNNSDLEDERKVLIITRMDTSYVKSTLVNILNKVKGLKAMALYPKEEHDLLELQTVIVSLQTASCIITSNQHIGANFPWKLFSLVVEYDFTENSCWIDVCKSLDIFYITFKSTLPETALEGNSSLDNMNSPMLDIRIPYMFIASEGLINTPRILQLMESKYNVTFIERRCNESLQQLGGTDRYVVITVDECTAIFMQSLDELDEERSADHVTLRLATLSLQYTCCWIILYSKEQQNSKYSLKGSTLHSMALIYAALIPSALKSEELEVKVILTPGFEETAVLIRQIADHTLLSCKRNPQEWMDKSWLSVLSCKEETSLLAFPCVNPLVAQLMLYKSPSLQWLLSASFDQLQERMPELPEKILKSFSDITSMHRFNSSASVQVRKQVTTPPENANDSSATSHCWSHSSHLQGSPGAGPRLHMVQLAAKAASTSQRDHRSYTDSEVLWTQSPLAIEPFYYKQSSPYHMQDNEVDGHFLQSLNTVDTERLPKAQFSRLDNLMSIGFSLGRNNSLCESTARPFSYCSSGMKSTPSYILMNQQNELQDWKWSTDQEMGHLSYEPLDFRGSAHSSLRNNEKSLLFQSQLAANDPERPEKRSLDLWDPPSEKDGFLVHELQSQQGFGSLQNEFTDMLYMGRATRSEGKMLQHTYSPIKQKPAMLQNTAVIQSTSAFSYNNSNLHFHQTGEAQMERKRSNPLSENRESRVLEGMHYSQLPPKLKRRRLSFEKVPGRCDGQTRLKFF
ncbi:protein shortage in chiasmata 1 ortholog [Lissotriton helveticus]